MMRSLWTAASGMVGQQFNIDTIANNLANVNTTGFKSNRPDFEDLLYQTLRVAGTPATEVTLVPTGIQVGHGVRPAATQKIFTQGALQSTGNVADLAIEGDGFFQIILPNGETAYSRDGAFKLDNQGRIVNGDGFALEPEITIPSDAVSITVGMDGTVSVLQAGETTPSEVGTIELTRFVNPSGLISMGKNLFITSEASGDEITGIAGENGLGTLAQGFLEMSNVSVVDEMVNMITAQRAYEANSKSIQTADDMLAIANNVKR